MNCIFFSHSTQKVCSHIVNSKRDIKKVMENVSILRKLSESSASLFSLFDSFILSAPKENYTDIKGKLP